MSAHPLTTQFFATLDAKKIPMSHVENRAGLAKDTIQHWRRGGRPRIDTFIAALNTLGLDLAVVAKEGKSA